MFVSNTKNLAKMEMKGPGIIGATKQVLIGPKEGWEGYVMRLMTLDIKGNTPKHSHPWPHINYVVKGKGTLFMDGKEYNVEEGAVSFVPDNIEHQYINSSDDEVFVFICIVPEEGDK
ncbi:MAG: cupin domain-containing protein [Peptococcales bacterium]|jgi:quercetin dioxygenase-like cupin family protein